MAGCYGCPPQKKNIVLNQQERLAGPSLSILKEKGILDICQDLHYKIFQKKLVTVPTLLWCRKFVEVKLELWSKIHNWKVWVEHVSPGPTLPGTVGRKCQWIPRVLQGCTATAKSWPFLRVSCPERKGLGKFGEVGVNGGNVKSFEGGPK